MSAQSNAPIIIKRKKVVSGDGHHGGAWKVAYADFVTAMMAFFLLMWLLGATSEKQRKGIADYFNPTIPVNRISGGGDGAFGGDSVLTEETLAENGTSPGAAFVDTTDGDADDFQARETELLEALEQTLRGNGGESMVSDLMARHIITRLTDEGLIIELFDLKDVILFERRTAKPTETLTILIQETIQFLQLVPNEIAVNGHTRTLPLVVQRNDNWDVSSSRAETVRSMIANSPVSDKRLQRVTGFADRKPASMNPMSERNNRVEIIVLRNRQ
jgi:chemotaxis protein MotB